MLTTLESIILGIAMLRNFPCKGQSTRVEIVFGIANKSKTKHLLRSANLTALDILVPTNGSHSLFGFKYLTNFVFEDPISSVLLYANIFFVGEIKAIKILS